MLDPVAYLSAGMYLALLVLSVRQMRCCGQRAEPVSWLVWAAHGLLYYLVYLIERRDGVVSNVQLWNLWSSTLRLHGLLTVVVIEYARLRRMGLGVRRG